MWLECIGVVSGWCCKEVCIIIDILILLIPIPLVLALFCSSIPTSLSFLKCFFVLVNKNIIGIFQCKNWGLT